MLCTVFFPRTLLGADSMIETLHDGVIARRLKSGVVAKWIAQSHVQAMGERGPPQGEIIPIIDHDEIGSGMIYLGDLSRHIRGRIVSILGKLLFREPLAMPDRKSLDHSQLFDT